jgi:hypothetical protein
MSQATGDNPTAGTATVSTAAQVASNTPCISVLIQCDQASSNNLAVGDVNSQPVVLKPGQAITISCSNLNKVYIAGSGGSAVANWIYVS